MNSAIKNTALILLSATTVFIGGCTNGMKGVEEVHVVKTDNGAMVVSTTTIKATVVAKDLTKGTITLASDTGGKHTYKVGKDVDAFSKVDVGDQITAVITEEVAVVVGLDVPDAVKAAGGVVIAPDGAAGTLVATVNLTGVVASVDVKKHKVTFTLEDGSKKTVSVRKDLDLARLPVGETVTVQVAQGVALSIEK